jgi:hypothetical protein
LADDDARQSDDGDKRQQHSLQMSASVVSLMSIPSDDGFGLVPLREADAEAAAAATLSSVSGQQVHHLMVKNESTQSLMSLPSDDDFGVAVVGELQKQPSSQPVSSDSDTNSDVVVDRTTTPTTEEDLPNEISAAAVPVMPQSEPASPTRSVASSDFNIVSQVTSQLL